jgi:integrase
MLSSTDDLIALDTPRIKVKKPRGRHPDKRLTAITVRNLKKPGRYADGNGLYLVVDDSGAKRWILRTVITGKRCDMGLGSVRLVPLADARDEATRLRRLARDGENPMRERRRAREGVPTFKQAAELVHAAYAPTFKNERHKTQWLDSLKADVFPEFGDLAVDQVQTSDILRALSRIWTIKPETARRLRQRIKIVLDWARAAGHRSGDNPVEGITHVLPKVKTQDRHHPALPYRHVPAFLEALRGVEGTASPKLAFEFLILTAARTSEVIGARWAEIDFESKTWTIPGGRIKAGREHRVPLSPRAVELLKQSQSMANGSEYVFAGRKPKAPLSNMAFLMILGRLNRRDITAHGFRSTFRDWAAEQTHFSRSVCEAALAHVVRDKTEAAYFRSDLFDQRRALMAAWELFATALPARVISMPA